MCDPTAFFTLGDSGMILAGRGLVVGVTPAGDDDAPKVDLATLNRVVRFLIMWNDGKLRMVSPKPIPLREPTIEVTAN